MPMADRPLSLGMAPQPPPVPEIEGYLKKLKRKTSNLSGSWNKRWFFVDHKRREFGYAKSKTPGAPRSSIYLNDITAVVQFDDTHFQVESRTRNFFLCGDSKACTTCWVKSLDEYRKRMVEFEREKAKHDAIVAAAQSQLSTDARLAFSPQVAAGESRRATNNATPAPSADEPRDSSSSSSASATAKRAGRPTERQPHIEERRTPSPAETRDSRDRDSSASRKPERQGDMSEHRHREPEKPREREREKDRGVARTNSRQFENRSIASSSSVRAHPGKGYVMQAWGDDDL